MRATAVLEDDRLEGWDEDELAGRRSRREGAKDDPAVGPEPPQRDRGAKDVGHRPGPDACDDPPEHVKLPEVGHQGERDESADDENEAAEHDPLRAEPVNQAAGQRRSKTEGEDADRYRERDAGAVPAELGLERPDEHARRRAHACRSEQDEERDKHDEPGIGQPTKHACDCSVTRPRYASQLPDARQARCHGATVSAGRHG